MKKLVLFTVSYPYGLKEQFLETEVLYLSEAFDEVIIIPTYCNGEKRRLPTNIRVDSTFAKENNLRKFFTSALSSQHFYRELIRFPSILVSLTRLTKLLAFLGKGNRLYQYLMNNYTNEYIFYSYWFNGSVFGLYLYNTHNKIINYCTRVHGSDVYLEVNKGYLPLRSQIFSDISKVFPISNNAKNYLLNHYTIDEKKVDVSKLGTLDPLNVTSANEGNYFHIVSCSHVTNVKRIPLLLESICLVANTRNKVALKWTHIGTGKALKNIKKTIKKVNIGNLEINLVGGLSNQNVFNFYKENNVDLFVNVSYSEGLPVSFMEALSCSIPVLALDNGGINEIINNTNGILLDKNASKTDIVNGIYDCIDNRQVLNKKKIKARSTWEKSYNAEVNYIKFCKELAEND